METEKKMMEEWQKKLISETRKTKNLEKEEMLDIIEEVTKKRSAELSYDEARRVILKLVKTNTRRIGDNKNRV